MKKESLASAHLSLFLITLLWGVWIVEYGVSGKAASIVGLVLVLAVILQGAIFRDRHMGRDQAVAEEKLAQAAIFLGGTWLITDQAKLQENATLSEVLSGRTRLQVFVARVCLVACVLGGAKVFGVPLHLALFLFAGVACLMVAAFSLNQFLMPLLLTSVSVAFSALLAVHAPPFMYGVYAILLFGTLAISRAARSNLLASETSESELRPEVESRVRGGVWESALAQGVLFLLILGAIHFLLPKKMPDFPKSAGTPSTRNSAETASSIATSAQGAQGNHSGASGGTGSVTGGNPEQANRVHMFDPGKPGGGGAIQGEGRGGSGEAPERVGGTGDPDEMRERLKKEVVQLEQGQDNGQELGASAASGGQGRGSEPAGVSTASQAGHDPWGGAQESSLQQADGSPHQNMTSAEAIKKGLEPVRVSWQKVWDWMRHFLKPLIPILIVVAGLLLFAHVTKKPMARETKRRKLSKEDRTKIRAAWRALGKKQISVEQEVLEKYRAFLQLMQAVELPKEEYLPPTDFSRRLEAHLPGLAIEARLITDVFCEVYFGATPPAHDRLTQFRRAADKTFDHFL